MARITDHCFVPNLQAPVADICQWENCGKAELEHEWTVEAEESNPIPDPIKAKLIERLAKLEAEIERLNMVIEGICDSYERQLESTRAAIKQAKEQK